MLTAPTTSLEGTQPGAFAPPLKKPVESGRLLGLDLLRFLAVTLVICRHVRISGDSWFSRILNVAHTGGSTGVDIFFALSGFLISGLLFGEYQKTGEIKLGRFLIRRGWKIYPPLWALVGFSLILWVTGHSQMFSKHKLLGEVLFLQNYIGGLWFTTWSLGVEEHFYLFLAAVVFVMLWFNSGKQRGASGPFHIIPALFVFMAIGCLIARIIRWRYHANDFSAVYVQYPTDCRMDALMFGVLLSYWWHFSRDDRFRHVVHRWRWGLLFLGVLGLAPAFIWNSDHNGPLCVFGVMAYSVGSGGLILGMLSFHDLERVRFLKHFGKLGTYSYSAYLWHGPVFIFLIQDFYGFYGSKDWLQFLVSFVGTWIAGIVAASLVEIPVLSLRERYFPRRAPAPV
jgi:peptidoglycan/LPS O-acetylase OafA/YrhL